MWILIGFWKDMMKNHLFLKYIALRIHLHYEGMSQLWHKSNSHPYDEELNIGKIYSGYLIPWCECTSSRKITSMSLNKSLGIHINDKGSCLTDVKYKYNRH